MAKKIIVIKYKRGLDWRSKFTSDGTNDGIIKIGFVRRGVLGKLLKTPVIIKRKLPVGFEVSKMENHKPKVRNITISLKKIK